MSRHGYQDDCDDLWSHIRYRGQVASAIRGMRGQRLLRDMVAALDAMPVKRLVAKVLEEDGEVCALGAVARHRGVDVSHIDVDYVDDDGDVPFLTAKALDIAEQLAREVSYENDELYDATPEARWQRMRDWAARQIVASPDELLEQDEEDGTQP
jgi:hypothetical protein